MPTVQTGLDRLRAEGCARLRGRRLGLLAHAAAVDRQLSGVREVLTAAALDLRVVFTPEHGWYGQAQDMEPVFAGAESPAAAPVVSLYGDSPESLHPDPDRLAQLDVLVVDLQDVGARYYTYATTMRHCLLACGRAGVDVLILDRPNPLGGSEREGPSLDTGFASFVGGFPVPIRHGLTIGELARLAQADGTEVSLEVLPLSGWRRDLYFDQTGLPWVMPSPNMPTLDTALVYPGCCLLEATNLSEGRGTTRPFEIVGAPWLDGPALAETLKRARLPGVEFRPLAFRPTFHKHAGQTCRGVQLHVTDRRRFRPLRTGLALLGACWAQDPGRFAWREAPYEFVADRPAIDLLTGSETLRLAIEAGDSLLDLGRDWERAGREWAAAVSAPLLYEP